MPRPSASEDLQSPHQDNEVFSHVQIQEEWQNRRAFGSGLSSPSASDWLRKSIFATAHIPELLINYPLHKDGFMGFWPRWSVASPLNLLELKSFCLRFLFARKIGTFYVCPLGSMLYNRGEIAQNRCRCYEELKMITRNFEAAGVAGEENVRRLRICNSPHLH